MIIPCRCFSCGKPVAHLWEQYKERIAKGETKKKVMDELGLERFCCRSLFLTHIDLLDDISVFKKDWAFLYVLKDIVFGTLKTLSFHGKKIFIKRKTK